MKLVQNRGVLLMVSILLSTSVYLSQNNTKGDLVPTMAVPVTNKTIVVDAGHGGEDGGAISNHGVSEAEINLKIALQLQQLLEQSGAEVVLTRSDENAIYDLDKKTLREKKVSDIKNRVKIGNESSADIFVSIHLNKINESKYDGWQTFYQKNNENSKKLATAIQDNLNIAMQKGNKRVPLKLDQIYIMKYVKIPTTVVECGFLSNPEEERNLQQEDYQQRLAWGIYNGIMDYFHLYHE